MYEIEAGRFHPDLDRYAAFYGSSRTRLVGVSAAYRFRDWLEAGFDIGRVRDRGTGMIAGSGEPGGSVTYELTPLQVFASFMLDRPGRRFVPYLDLGLATAFYVEDIDLEPDRRGRADAGGAAHAGLLWRFASAGGAGDARRSDTFWRGYVFLEAQRFSSKAAGVDLGGTAYLLGVRVEFQLDRGGT
jgi:hypothetical protein